MSRIVLFSGNWSAVPLTATFTRASMCRALARASLSNTLSNPSLVEHYRRQSLRCHLSADAAGVTQLAVARIIPQPHEEVNRGGEA